MYSQVAHFEVSAIDTDYTVIPSPGIGKRIVVNSSFSHNSDIQGHWHEDSGSGSDIGPVVPVGMELMITLAENTKLVYRANYVGSNTFISVYFSVVDV